MHVDVSLTGRLLVATPRLDDPTFVRTVVLIIDHDEDGALGVVLNRASDVPVAEADEDWAPLASAPPVLFGGGPVEPDALVALGRLTPLASRADTTIVERIQLIDLDEEASAAAATVEDLRVFAGYAGWAPGQLEAELALDAWIALDAQVGDVFTGDPEGLWARVLRRQGGRLAVLATIPEDPSRN
jgi:putative transcriptional regulator